MIFLSINKVPMTNPSYTFWSNVGWWGDATITPEQYNTTDKYNSKTRTAAYLWTWFVTVEVTASEK